MADGVVACHTFARRGGGGSDDPDNPGDDPKDPGDDPVLTYTLPGGTVFKMIMTPEIAVNNNFPTGTDDSGSRDAKAKHRQLAGGMGA